jgi:hypothetical protein
MTEEAMSPDERVFRSHLERVDFRVGVERKRWRFVEIAWPWVIIGVTAAERASGPDEFMLRFELSNYPTAGPTAGLWDPIEKAYLTADRRPKGRRQTLVFRADWEGGEALYHPCDRRAVTGHPAWVGESPAAAWGASSDITHYLKQVSELLMAEDYEGV